MKSVKFILLVFASMVALTGMAHTQGVAEHGQEGFVSVSQGQLMWHGRPYHFVGTNLWYGAILGSEGEGGNRHRLRQELDLMKKTGINNVRILVGADGRDVAKAKVRPSLQLAPGVYNDTILAGLDYLLAEMGKRGMVAVLYLNNSWEWSGGYNYYLEQAGAGPSVWPQDGYQAYVDHVAQFAVNRKAQQLFFDYVRFIITRTNRYTHQRYVDDPTIMSWQVGNEPRAFASDRLPQFERWLRECSALIRSLDNHHLISVGSEGAVGCEGSYDSWERICSDANIDYCNIHLWPTNWQWVNRDSILEGLPLGEALCKDYILRHLDIARRLGKPLVMEEFGYPRDGGQYAPGSPTVARDRFYQFIFDLFCQDVNSHGAFAGVNFWAWSGKARPRHVWWMAGDDLCGDPAQEQQGLYSVFEKDKSTMRLIRTYCKKVNIQNPTI